MKQEAKCLLTVLIARTHAGVLFIKFVGSSSKTLFSSPKSVVKIAHFMYNFNCTIYPLHHGIGQWLLSHFLLLWFVTTTESDLQHWSAAEYHCHTHTTQTLDYGSIQIRWFVDACTCCAISCSTILHQMAMLQTVMAFSKCLISSLCCEHYSTDTLYSATVCVSRSRSFDTLGKGSLESVIWTLKSRD